MLNRKVAKPRLRTSGWRDYRVGRAKSMLLAVFTLMLSNIANAQDIDGLWRSNGWGLTLEIAGNQITIGEVTEVSHLRFGPLSLQENALNLGDGTTLQFSLSGEQLLASTMDAQIILDRQSSLPSATMATDSSSVNFLVFWQSYQELFAQFDLVDEDWQAVRELYEGEVAAGISEARLYNIFRELLMLLGDRHSYIRRTDPVMDFAPRRGSTSELWRSQSNLMLGITESYLDAPLIPSGDSRLRWSTLDNGSVGYVLVSGLDFVIQGNEVVLVGDAFDNVLVQLSDIGALIIDFRFNQGGRVSNGLSLASRLTDRERHAFTRLTRTGGMDEFGQQEEIFYSAAGETRPDLPILLLTSNGTASSAEVTAIALAQHERVTLIGEKTVGILSSVLDRELPNGWTFGLSHQRIKSSSGTDYERVGVPPDIQVSDSEAMFDQGSDAILESALTFLDRQTPVPPGSFEVSPALSGAWFDPAHDGEGWILEVLPGDRALLYWFTYPPPGDPSENAWLVAVGEVQNDRILFENVLRPEGTQFGEDFDSNEIVANQWGRLELRFSTCNAGELLYSGSGGFSANRLALVRLSSIDGLSCSPDAPAFAISPYTGSWFDSSHNGEGWILQALPDGRVLLYWFTYDKDGDQMWLTGVGETDGLAVSFPQLVRVAGPKFGPAFDQSDTEILFWGALEITFTSCGSGVLTFDSDLAGFGAGEYQLSRITQLAGLPCEETGQ